MISKKSILILLMLCFSGAVYGQSTEQTQVDEENISDDAYLHILRNKFGDITARLDALKKLAGSEDPDFLSEILDLAADISEPIILRSQIIEVAAKSADPSAGVLLTQILSNTTLHPKTREMTLYALWNRDPISMEPRLAQIAQNQMEDPSLRAAAITYLSQSETKMSANFWKAIYSNQNNAAVVRITSLTALKNQGYAPQAIPDIKRIVESSTENPEVRQTSLLAAQQTFEPALFENILLSFLGNPQNPSDLRRFCLSLITSNPNEMLVTRLRQIRSQEKNVDLIRDIDRAIEQMSPDEPLVSF